MTLSDEPLISEREVAQRTGTSAKMWQNRRSNGDSPPYVKVGRAVRYRWSQVQAWLVERDGSKGAKAA